MKHYSPYKNKTNFTCGNSQCLPIEVTKCWCASSVFWFLLFLTSHTRIVLSSDALIMNLPPEWNTRPRTQLSWPTFNITQHVWSTYYSASFICRLRWTQFYTDPTIFGTIVLNCSFSFLYFRMLYWHYITYLLYAKHHKKLM